jgi:predicted small lipoprotein YifL
MMKCDFFDKLHDLMETNKMKKSLALLFAFALVVAFTACGKKEPAAKAVTAAQAQAADDAGKAIVDEILAAFDQCVAEAAALAKDKPEAAALMPRLERLYADYGVKMAALNARFLALRDQDRFAFARANGYMTDNRPAHVHAMYNTLTPALQYYNQEKGETAVADLLTRGVVKLLDDATKQ